VPAARRAALAAAIKKSGFPPQALDKMETWAAAFILLGNQFRDLGLKGDEGVEAVLRNTFTSEGKPIDELETNVQQLGFFDGLPEAAQRQLLDGAIDASDEMKKDLGMLAAGRAAMSRNCADIQPRPCCLARPPKRFSSAATPIGAMDRATNDPARRGVHRRRSGPPGPRPIIERLKHDGYSVRRVQ
jgi:hypothetical protein